MTQGETSKFETTIAMTPVAKQRARVVVAGGRARGYTPDGTAAAEQIIRGTVWQQKSRGAVYFERAVPLRMELVFSFAKPKRMKNHWPTGRADIDNLTKTVMDALGGLLYDNDSQVVQLVVWKEYGQPGAGGQVHISVQKVGS